MQVTFGRFALVKDVFLSFGTRFDALCLAHSKFNRKQTSNCRAVINKPKLVFSFCLHVGVFLTN